MFVQDKTISPSVNIQEASSVNVKPLRRYRILFLYIAQAHQTFHSLPIAFEMAKRQPDIDVVVCCVTQHHLSYIYSLAELYDNPPIRYELLPIPQWLRKKIAWKGPGILRKIFALFLSRNYFKQFDAIIVPERTTLFLKRMGVTKPRYIYTQHGAGDRAVGFAKDIKQFDFVFVPGKKIEKRFLKTDLTNGGDYYRGTYVKFDLVKKIQQKHREKVFNNNRPTVLYNPHFFPNLTSWYHFGAKILNFFAHQEKYNLIFAPHFRLLNGDNEKSRALIKKYEHCPQIYIDPGSAKSIDMTYTLQADIYLGDVSSQIAEFLTRQRPCIFLNAYKRQWNDNEDYRFWKLGQTIDNIDQLQGALDNAFARQKHYQNLQKSYYEETFDTPYDGPETAPDAVNAVVAYLNKSCNG